jgi:diguanylate cyclase (GGDEF)-like protein
VEGATRLQTLSAVARLVAEAASVQELVAGSAQAALELLDSDAVAVSRLDRTEARVSVLHRAGRLEPGQQRWPDAEHYPLAHRAGDAGRTPGPQRHWAGTVEDFAAIASSPDRLRQVGGDTCAAFPILLGGDVWGDVCVSRRDDLQYVEADVALGLVLTGLISAGLSRLALQSEMSRLANTDPLTGLANRRVVGSWLEERLGAQEPFPPVSVVLCDVNGLKGVNDAYGHGAGDELIRMVGPQLLAITAEYPGSVVARIGGDEFVVLLEGLSPEQVRDLVERIAALELPNAAGLSVGTATAAGRLPGADDAATAARALMRLADAAQYEHKLTRRLTRDLPPPAHAPAPEAIAMSSFDTEQVLAALMEVPPEAVEHRLSIVTAAVAECFDAASWWLSRAEGGEIVDVLGRMRHTDRSVLPLNLVSGVQLDLGDFPATERVLNGGAYYASLTEGHESERILVARMGYLAVLAAGDVDGDGRRWLVEIYADALTTHGMSVGLPLLRALVRLAVTPPLIS